MVTKQILDEFHSRSLGDLAAKELKVLFALRFKAWLFFHRFLTINSHPRDYWKASSSCCDLLLSNLLWRNVSNNPVYIFLAGSAYLWAAEL